MKRSILITCTVLSALSLAAFITDINPLTSVNNLATVDLVYDIDSRFIATISKAKLSEAKSIKDIIPAKATSNKISYQFVKVSIIQEGNERGELGAVGESHFLNAAQLALLDGTDYTSNIFVSASCISKFADTSEIRKDSIAYYLSVKPENEAKYKDGKDALIEYLRENSKEKTGVITQEKLQPGKVSFTVANNGTIKDVVLSATSGYASVDEVLVEVIKTLPGKWEPATNSKGEKVDQKFVFFFGLMGC